MTKKRSVSIERLLEGLSNMFPALAPTISGYRRPTSILEDDLVSGWFSKAMVVNEPSTVRLQYHIIKVAGGDDVPRSVIEKAKVIWSTCLGIWGIANAMQTSYEGVRDDNPGMDCLALERWFKQNLNKDSARLKGKERATDVEEQMIIDPPEDVRDHLVSCLWGLVRGSLL